MRSPRQTIGIMAVGLALFTRSLSAQDRSVKPNIIVVLIDDMGWADTGFAGNEIIETPNLDDLAAGGVIFDQAYAAAPNCAPSRACLLTGLYTPRHGVYTVVDERHSPGQPHHPILSAESRASMDSGIVTIAETLGENGYETGMAGMWNLGTGKSGPTTPTGQGIDSYVEPGDLNFERDEYHNPDGEFLTDRLTDSAMAFVRESRSRPFFLYLAYHAIHAPFDPDASLVNKYRNKTVGMDVPRDFAEYAATVETVDRNIGRLWEEIRSLGLEGETYLFFTSDNGATHDYTPPLREGKGTLYEGGIRVPMFILGPNIPSNQRSAEPVSGIDIYPTVVDLVGAQSSPVDGESLLPLFKGSPDLDRDHLFWHFPCYIGRGEPVSAVRSGNYKLIEFFESDTVELYNLAEDAGECHNLADVEPELADKLYSVLRQWQEEIEAPCPGLPNPAFDPAAHSSSAQRGIKPSKPGQ